MAKYFVGQKVRMARPVNPKYLNDTGRIFLIARISWGDLIRGDRCGSGDCAVDWDGGGWSPEYLDKLEPILPEGHRAGDFPFSELMDKCRAGEGVPA